MRRYDTYTREIIPIQFTQPPGFKPRQSNGLLPHGRLMTSHPPVISNDAQPFPILPDQLEKHLEHPQHLAHDIPTQVFPTSGPAPSRSPGETLVLNPPPETLPTVYAFQASTLGMPSMAEYTRFLARYLNELVPNRRGKALIDSELLERIKLVLTFDESLGSCSVRDTPYSIGGSWDTTPFRRWVRNTFVYRQATQAELERAIDFGLLSPPESSLSGPGVPGHAPCICLSYSMNLVFHQDRPVAVWSRIYKVILRAHWITNHAGRDRTWALVQEVCSYIPKRLVHDFVAACPACRVARSGQYGAHTGSSRGMSTDGRKFQQGSKHRDDKGLIAERALTPTFFTQPHHTYLEGWILQVGHDTAHQSYHISMSTDPLRCHREVNTPMAADSAPGLPSVAAQSPPLFVSSPPVIPVSHQAVDNSQQPDHRDQDVQESQQETPMDEPLCLFWAGIQKLVEARRERGEEVNVLIDSPALKRNAGLLVSEETIETI